VSRENVDLVRQGNAAIRRGDWETVADGLDPHVLVRPDPRWPEQHIYGREAVIAWYRDVTEPGGSDICIEDTMDLGDRVLARLCWRVRGSRSGIEGEQRMSVLFTMRAGRVILEEFFLEHEQALEALRLGD
jgi:ketosteroid isomerase-like protein